MSQLHCESAILKNCAHLPIGSQGNDPGRRITTTAAMYESESFDTSSNTLRRVIPLMSQRRIPLTPPNYTVWYGYAGGHNQALAEAIEERIKAGDTIDESTTRRWYEQYFIGGDGTDPGTQEQLRNIVGTLSRSLTAAGREVDAYGQSLSLSADKIDGASSPEELRKVIGELADSTRRMQESNAALEADLQASRRESESLREQLSQTREQATTDPLTGLLNRRGFDEGVADILAAAETGASHCLLIGDIDRFKLVNDTYGHGFGDKIIKVVADAFGRLTKGKDLVARFGGEEFVILLPETDLNGAATLAESIRRHIESGRVYNPKTGEEIQRVTISIGVAGLLPGESLDQTIERADQALYRAKQDGRNRVELASADSALAAAG